VKKLLLLMFLVVGSGFGNPDNYLREAACSAEKNSLSNIILALRAGANPNLEINGKSYFTWMIEYKNSNLFLTLLDYGAKFTINDLKLMHKDRMFWAPSIYNISRSYYFQEYQEYYAHYWLPFFGNDWNENCDLILDLRSKNALV